VAIGAGNTARGVGAAAPRVKSETSAVPTFPSTLLLKPAKVECQHVAAETEGEADEGVVDHAEAVEVGSVKVAIKPVSWVVWKREVRVGGVAPAGFQAILAGGFEFFRKCVWERPGFEVSPPTNWLNSSRVTIFPRKA